MAKRKSRAKYKRTRVKSPKKFDKRSFRTIDPGRPKHTLLVIGCPRGKYDAKKKKCKVGTQVQAILEGK